jgi:hypothetical protein
MATTPPSARTTRRPQGAVSPAPARCSPILTETSWSPRQELALTDWLRHGRCLGSVGRASGWWIGDWSRYGSARYGEKYAVAARITGYDVQSLMNMAYVASRFEISRRRERLSFSHHAELAALASDEQDCWLDRAELECLSVRALRARLRRPAHPPGHLALSRSAVGAGVSGEGKRPQDRSADVVCPHCGHHFRPESTAERE